MGISLIPLVVLVFAMVFAAIEAWKGAPGLRPTSFGWLAITLLIFVEIFYHGMGVFK